jgi:hypothetical protein
MLFWFSLRIRQWYGLVSRRLTAQTSLRGSLILNTRPTQVATYVPAPRRRIGRSFLRLSRHNDGARPRDTVAFVRRAQNRHSPLKTEDKRQKAKMRDESGPHPVIG